jgi:lysophospholipid acyltransferase (LPLAT)-like uncharacterized protein
MSLENQEIAVSQKLPSVEQVSAPKRKTSWSRRIGDSLTFFLATRFGHLLWLLAGRWTKITVVGGDKVWKIREKGAGFTYAVWHGRMLIPVYHERHRGIIAMVSEHRDGELVARVVHKLGYRTARGSSTRGGRKAFMEMVRNLRNGKEGAMLPDGPKGPRHVFKPGTMLMAQRAQIPLVTITYAAHPAWTLRSWDRFVVPKPFSRSVMLIGEPLHIDKSLKGVEFEALRKKIETRMIHEVELCDAMAKGEIPIPSPDPDRNH